MTPGWQNRRHPERGYRRILSVLRADIRRYEPPGPAFHDVACGRPRVRTEGVCGRNASHTERLTDPATGEHHWVGACSNTACRAWLTAVVERNKLEIVEHPPPAPPANTGGVLERHLPEIDWGAIYRRPDDTWTPPPEGEAWRRPKLQLVLGDAEDLLQPTVSSRPALTVLKGGW